MFSRTKELDNTPCKCPVPDGAYEITAERDILLQQLRNALANKQRHDMSEAIRIDDTLRHLLSNLLITNAIHKTEFCKGGK